MYTLTHSLLVVVLLYSTLHACMLCTIHCGSVVLWYTVQYTASVSVVLHLFISSSLHLFISSSLASSSTTAEEREEREERYDREETYCKEVVGVPLPSSAHTPR